MIWVIGFYAIQLLVLIILIFGSWYIWDRRFKTDKGQPIPPGFVRTNEVSYDPSTGKKMTVYFNAETGERFYKEEKN